MKMAVEGRTTIYNNITDEEKLKQVNEENLELENEFLYYLSSIDRADTTISQYRAALHIFWCWNLDNNKNKSFVELTKREIARFQNHAISVWGWSPRRIRMVKSVMRSLENYILNILDDDYPNYRKIWDKIESPVNQAVRKKSVFTDEELQSLLDVLIEKKEYLKACVLALITYGGRRKSEIVRFKVSYFDKKNLICGGALYKTPEEIRTKGRGKMGKMLICYTLAKPFQPYFDMWMEERKRLGIESDWLFPKCADGKWIDEPMSPSVIDSYAKTFSNILGKPWYPHCGRHRAVSRYAENGIPDSVIKDIFGWKTIDLEGVYNDTEAEDTFDQYFDAEGIKKIEKKGIEDL